MFDTCLESTTRAIERRALVRVAAGLVGHATATTFRAERAELSVDASRRDALALARCLRDADILEKDLLSPRTFRAPIELRRCCEFRDDRVELLLSLRLEAEARRALPDTQDDRHRAGLLVDVTDRDISRGLGVAIDDVDGLEVCLRISRRKQERNDHPLENGFGWPFETAKVNGRTCGTHDISPFWLQSRTSKIV